jgi:putative ABC transport system permease protein
MLTALGIAIGVASIVLILSLSGSIREIISGQVRAMGANLIVVRPESGKSTVDGLVGELTASSKFQKSNLTFDDVRRITEIDEVAVVAPVLVSEEPVTVGNTIYPAVDIVGTNTDFDDIMSITMKTGQFFGESSRDEMAVVGSEIAMRLFGTTDAIGRTVHIGEHQLMIVGVMDEMTDPINFNNVDLDNALVINSKFIQAKDIQMQIQQIDVRTGSSEQVAGVSEQIAERLKGARGGVENFSVNSGENISHPAGSLFGVVTAMLSLVAGVSLVVGGIGVMNIMFVSVAERTREIGIRKAVGASSTNILLQFLFEALILSLMGGLLGLALGYAVAFLVSLWTPFPPFISGEIVGLAFAIAIVIGSVFGLLPAIRAARKDPIDSLKFYR